ncbi:hypothetical protein [Bacillus sp. S/N-304-OC-R1]|uniref:hypothetical protein n=1 Tax=Bacillus sp. S/N-304-OC-R1 TaxID=2758034 RepID=UPI001C8E265C|nr:hypothetical protein [Bacillus sp. S/N-304-OC-R1]MBY0122179.1 hypothetical protein [Bacillus sp. S/N-304-OC-R1]
MNRKEIAAVLNSFEVIESSGGEEAYALVANTEENRKELNEVGVPSDVINGYGDEDTFCILSLGFSEGYIDLYDGEKVIAFDESIEFEMDGNKSVTLYKNEGEYFLCVSNDGGSVDIMNISDEQRETIKKILC